MRNEIRSYYPQHDEERDIVLAQRRIDAMTVDPLNNVVYWSDDTLHKIYRSKVPMAASQLGIPQDLGIRFVQNVIDMAYDWLGE